MEDNQVTGEASNKPKYERKCERDFRKLLESDNNVNNNVTYSKKKCDFPENAKKKFKSDEQIVKEPTLDGSSCVSTIQKSSSKNINHPGILTSEADFISPLKIDLPSLFENLSQQSCTESRCQSVIRLAVFCSEKPSSTEIFTIFKALNFLSDSHKYDVLAISHSVLFLTLTRITDINLHQLIDLENSILKLANSVIINSNELGNQSSGSRLALLRGEEYLFASKLCQQLFSRRNVDIDAVDVFTLCCLSLRNLSCHNIAKNYEYQPNTLKFILGMTGKATQEIVSENLVEDDGDVFTVVSAPSYMVSQCLQILQHMLTIDPDLPSETLEHEDFSLLHCLTRLLEWCMSFLFQNVQSENHVNVENPLSPFHLDTLLSILKILTIVTIDPVLLDSFTNRRGLMEKFMLCILCTYYQSMEKHFDVLVLALELMINFSLLNKKTFLLLCLKKFQIPDCERVLAIEALLMILIISLEKINEIKTRSLTLNPNGEGLQNNDENPEEIVLKAADKDMELSTIVSFICILVTFFMETKTSFVGFIRERLSVEKTTEAITVSNKVFEFATITRGMPVTGLALLDNAMRKLHQLHPST